MGKSCIGIGVQVMSMLVVKKLSLRNVLCNFFLKLFLTYRLQLLSCCTSYYVIREIESVY